MLSKLRGQLEEMKCKVQFLGLVKKYLQASPPHPAHPLPQHLVAEASQTEAPASPRTQVMYAERWGLEPCALPVIVNISAAHCDTLDFSPLDESSSLIFYNVSKHPRGGKQRKARVLQAGTPLGLMAYLYSRCGCPAPSGEAGLGVPWTLSCLLKAKGRPKKRNRPPGESLCLPSSDVGLYFF